LGGGIVSACVDPARFFAFFLDDVLASARGADSGACRRQVCRALFVRGLGGLRAVGVRGGFFAAESPCGALVVARGADVSILIGRDCTVPGVNVAPGGRVGAALVVAVGVLPGLAAGVAAQ
jgi:hypothetical protein